MKALLVLFLGSIVVALAFALVMVLTLPFTIFNAFVLTKLWLWFAVPYGAPTINVAHAYGISLLVGFFFSGLYTNVEAIKEAVIEKTEGFMPSIGRLLQAAAMTTMTCSMALLFGYIVHTYFW